MVKKFNVYTILTLSLVIILMLVECKVRTEEPAVQADVILYNISVELDLLEHWKKNYSKDSYLEKKIKHLILNDLIAVSNIDFRVKELQGTPLETLFRAVEYNNKNELVVEEMEIAFQPAKDYLNSIENEVEQTLSERDKKRVDELKKIIKQK